MNLRPTPSHPRSVRQWVWCLFWPVGLAAAIFLASGQSEIAAPEGFVRIDKLAHFSLFGLLATLSLRVFFNALHPLRTAISAAGIVVLYGLADEFRQSFTPGRSVEFADWIADTSGALLAVTTYSFWPAYRRLLEWPLWGRPLPPWHGPDDTNTGRGNDAARPAAVRPISAP